MSIGRPLEFDPDRAVGQAMQVFWSRGYESTSLRHLLGAMNLSKSSLYQAFGSKEQLFDRCVKRYLDDVAGRMLEQLHRAKSGRAFIEDTFRGLAAEVGGSNAEKGCLLWNSAAEFGQREAKIGDLISNGIDRFVDVFTAAVKRAQEEGDIGTARSPRALATYLLSSMGGLRTMLKGGLDERRAKEIVRIILQSLD